MQDLLSLRGKGAALAGGSRKSSIGGYSEYSLIQPNQKSVAEVQAFLVTLIREFSFSLPEGRNIRTVRPGILVPMVIGEEDKGPQLPLVVTPVRDL